MKRQLDMVNIDILVPEHGRTSCSDENLDNQYRHPESGYARCLRCYLLSRLGEVEYIEDLPIIITVGHEPKMVKETVTIERPMPD